MAERLEKAKHHLFNQLRREIRDEKVLRAMEQVPREFFVPSESWDRAYIDQPLPIGDGQTISQPYIVALMTSGLELRGSEKVMEVGTGSGYQAAVLSRLVPDGSALSLERIPALARSAETRLRMLEYDNVEVRIAADTLGCPESGPFDAIIVAAASPQLPPSLLEQMAVGGRMIIPIGTLEDQELVKVIRTGEGHSVRMLGPCRFVPLVGTDAWPRYYDEL